jgi:hypothetical protein
MEQQNTLESQPAAVDAPVPALTPNTEAQVARIAQALTPVAAPAVPAAEAPATENAPAEAPDEAVPYDDTSPEPSASTPAGGDAGPNEAPGEPKGSGDDVPPASPQRGPRTQESGLSEPEPAVQAAGRTFTQAETDARLAAQRTRLQSEHAKQIRELELKVEAARLAPGLGIEDVDVVMSNIDRKALAYNAEGKPANLADLLAAAVDKLAAAVGSPKNLSSGLPTSPEAREVSSARSLADFPRIGSPGLFKK